MNSNKTNKHYQYILFDVGGTLIRAKPGVGHIYSEGALKFGIKINPEEAIKKFFQAWKKVKGQWASALYYGQTEKAAKDFWFQIVTETFAPYCNGMDVYPLFDYLYHRFAKSSSWETYPEVVPVLEALKKRGFALGLLSNWDVRLGQIVQDLKLIKYFDHCFFSFEIGLEKPDIRFFQYALDIIKLQPDKVLYIGNDYEDDFVPSRQLKMDCLIIDRKDHINIKHNISAITTLQDILDIIA